MKDEDAVPKFTRPGDNPEIDRILAEIKAEPPPVGRGTDLFGRPFRRLGRATANVKTPAGAAAATEAAPVSKARRRERWIALAALGIVGPVTALAIGRLRPRGPEVVVAPVSVSGAPTGRVEVKAPVEGPRASAAPSAAEAARAPAASSVASTQRLVSNKKRAQPQTADAGAAPPAVSPDFLE